jgi:hypothetical protein
MNVRTRRIQWALMAVVALGVALAGAGAVRLPPARAQGPTGMRLYGHDNGHSTIILIDTATGTATTMGPTGFASGSSGMATAMGTVPGPGGSRYAAGTFFGVITDKGNGRDYVVVVDPASGATTKLVALSQNLGGRGVAFGADGVTLYVIDGSGMLAVVDTVTGLVTPVGMVTDSGGNRLSSDNLEWDPDTASFFAFVNSGANSRLLVSIDPATAAATAVGTLSGFSTCSLVRAPNPVPGPGGVDWPTGTWFAVNQLDSTLLAIDVDAAAPAVRVNSVVGPLGPESSGQVCGTAFTLPRLPPTPTPEPTAVPTPEPTAVADCVCWIVVRWVPPAVISDALANPTDYYGWLAPQNPNAPPSPVNPPRRCLSLQNINLPYHYLNNAPVWHAGCP